MAVFDPDLQPSSDRGHLLTEQSNQRSSHLAQLDTLALVELFPPYFLQKILLYLLHPRLQKRV